MKTMLGIKLKISCQKNKDTEDYSTAGKFCYFTYVFSRRLCLVFFF